jgi:ABC-type molybdate transport system substrate-binding protein
MQPYTLVRNALSPFCFLLLAALSMTGAIAAELDVFHADSLAGPMRALKPAFEAKHPGVTLKFTSGVSRDLARRIRDGDACDVFAPSSPAVIDEDLMNRKLAGSDKEAATWYVVFSANEMVVITAKGNPLGIRQVSDLAGPQVKFVRITGEKDLATGRTIEFIKRATALEGKPDLRGDPQCGDRPGHRTQSERGHRIRRISAHPGGTGHPQGLGPASGGAGAAQGCVSRVRVA